MINLLPDETKKQLRAARTNVILARYTFIVLLAAAFLGIVLAGSYVLLTQTRSSAQELIAANDTKAEVFSETQQQISVLSSDLSEARIILDQQKSYASVLRALGQSMTAGTVIDEVELTPQSFTGAPISVTLYATSSEATVALGESLRSSGVFSNINIESVSEQGGIEGYPVSATITMAITGGVQ